MSDRRARNTTRACGLFDHILGRVRGKEINLALNLGEDDLFISEVI